jgi:hypothetical protein
VIDGGQRDIQDAVRLAERALTPELWLKLPAAVRSAGEAQQRGPGGFNAVALIDRMLANPIPVLLALADTLALSTDQVAQIQALSAELQATLDTRREELGKRFDNAQNGPQQGRIFQEIQPEIEATREEVRAALQAVQKILTGDQWKLVPDRIKNPFQQGGRRGGTS